MAPTTNPGGLADKVRRQLADEVRNLAGAIGERAVSVVSEKVTGATGRLSEYAKQGGGPGLIAAATGAQRLAEGDSPMKAMIHAGLAGGKEKVMSALGRGAATKGGGKKLKVTNIVETIEVGVPVRVAYNQWTQFGDFPSFMKKVENVDTQSDERLTWKAQVFWSHRTWESTIVRQIPDRLIHWRSKGEKGSVDGTVSFHALTPDLTRILVVLEYHPQGLFEHTGNLWRAQGRRVRLELKHFVRHVMTQTAIDPESVEGWRGEIEDSQVVRDHDTAVREETAEEEPAVEEPRRERARPAARGRREPVRRRPVDEEYDEYEDEYDEGYDEYEEPEEPEEPAPSRPARRPAPERARRARSREESEPREEPRTRRAPQTPRRPVVRRRREESDE
ncbi:SRPBCC family protein [Micromonospora sp. WMMD812]|uniref:SRPBCC family protein n=1 Tax=Micromonospora sp. WMMD812 TaxID=3015152 RepID=UPI00248BF559|nr:SRPBCC family protein [Micromonospora sp. WMMD812]WBB66134.1 SRPBCC family protein [Micromonospora sp. WMMD812]